MVSGKTADVAKTGADTPLAGGHGCLLNIAGCLPRQSSAVRFRHVAEMLAGMTGDVPPIGHGTDDGRPR